MALWSRPCTRDGHRATYVDEYQCSGALRSDELPARVQLDSIEEALILDELARPRAAPDEHRIGLGRKCQIKLGSYLRQDLFQIFLRDIGKEVTVHAHGIAEEGLPDAAVEQMCPIKIESLDSSHRDSATMMRRPSIGSFKSLEKY